MGEKSVPSVPVKAMGNIRTIAPAKRWVFTLNNYTNEDIRTILFVFQTFIYVFQEEIGEKKKTPHLQGMVIFPKKLRPFTLTLDRRICWEKMKGTPAQAILYCMKEDTRKKNGRFWYKNIPAKFGAPKRPPNTLNIQQMFYWQWQVYNFIQSPPQKRKIWWLWEGEGGSGKTALQKFLYVHNDALILSGKRNDLKNGILNYITTKKRDPKIILINIPKVSNLVSWAGLEEIKDGLFYSGKYEGGMVCYDEPHVIVFSNYRPNNSGITISKDKLKIRRIWHGRLVNEEAIEKIQRIWREDKQFSVHLNEIDTDDEEKPKFDWDKFQIVNSLN